MKYLMMIGFALLSHFVSLCQMPGIIRQQCIGSPGTDYGKCIIKTSLGYLTGISLGEYEPGATNWHGGVDIWLVETDSLGNTVWERCYGGSGGDSPIKLVKAFGDGYYLIGCTDSSDGDIQSYNHGLGDYWVVKLNDDREIVWEKCFGTVVTKCPRDALLTPDGGLLVMGRILCFRG